MERVCGEVELFPEVFPPFGCAALPGSLGDGFSYTPREQPDRHEQISTHGKRCENGSVGLIFGATCTAWRAWSESGPQKPPRTGPEPPNFSFLVDFEPEKS